MKTNTNGYRCNVRTFTFVAVVCILESGNCAAASGITRNVSACSAPANDGTTIYMTLGCGEDERIFIREALYGFRYGGPRDCDVIQGRCAEASLCTMSPGDDTMVYGDNHKYEVYQNCSWKRECTVRARTGYKSKQKSVYSALIYECVKDKTVLHFCNEANVTGNSINIIFEREGFYEAESRLEECVCDLTPLSHSVRYKISAPDLRLMSEDKTCDSQATLSGITNTNITCASQLGTRNPSKELLGKKYIQLSFKLRPEFIWIKVNVEDAERPPVGQYVDKNKLLVHCFKSTREQVHVASGKSPKDSPVPVPAIAVPVILIVAGLGVIAIFVFRKRHEGNKKSLQAKDKSTEDEPTQKVKNYNSSFTINGVVRTEENYIVLEPENAYDTINFEDAEIATEGTYNKLLLITKTEDKLTTDTTSVADNSKAFDCLSQANKCIDSKLDLTKKEPYNAVMNQPSATLNKGFEEETHSYFVLDPQSLYLSSDMAGLSIKDHSDMSTTETAIVPQFNGSTEEQRNYFTVEPTSDKF